MPAEGDPNAMVTEAVHNFFDYKAELVRREVAQLLRQGRISLAIGLAFLALCLIAANALGGFASGTALTVGRESLTIGGWVAMWRPSRFFCTTGGRSRAAGASTATSPTPRCGIGGQGLKGACHKMEMWRSHNVKKY